MNLRLPERRAYSVRLAPTGGSSHETRADDTEDFRPECDRP
jgi:hypothetical protein